MWQGALYTPSNQANDVQTNGQLRSQLSAASMPSNIAVANGRASAADSDSDRRAELIRFSQALQQIIIDPWSNGQSTQNKQNANFWLSPTDAISQLKQNLERTPWQAAVCFLVSGANALALSDALNNFLNVLPNAELQRCCRHAQSLAKHEQEKLFIKAESINSETSTQLEQTTALGHSSAKQNVAISEAFASDKNPTAMLADFQSRRAERLQQISSELNTIKSGGGALGKALYLNGNYLGQELAQHAVPDENDPLCCLWVLGGSTNAVAPLKEVLGL